MARFFALLSAIVILTGCQSSGETVIGRANGRDIVVTESEIAKRADERGVSRTVALRELRREREMRTAIEMQREWKARDNVYVEGAKIRTQTDEPEAPNEAEISKFVSKQQAKRALARTAALEEPDEEGESEEEEKHSIETDRDQDSAVEKDLDVINRISLPSATPQFEQREGQEGWQTLPASNKSPR